jgi:hypothetical protein
MSDQMKNVVEDEGELQEWYVWSAIQYLDPESTSSSRGMPIVAVIAFVVICWIVFLTAMCSITIRAANTDPSHFSFPWLSLSCNPDQRANRLDPRSFTRDLHRACGGIFSTETVSSAEHQT